MSSTTIILKDNGEVIVEEWPEPYVKGARIAEGVKGYFETLNCNRIHLWFPDHIDPQHKPNFNATMIGAAFKQEHVPALMGPVVVTGPPDGDGNTHGLTHDQVERILKLTR